MTDLPALTGRDWEIGEAQACRTAMLDRLTAAIATSAGDAPAGLITQLADLYREVAVRQTTANWWIAHADHKMGPTVRALFTPDDVVRLAELAAHRDAAQNRAQGEVNNVGRR